MARLPKDTDEAVALLGLSEGASMVVVAPAAGYVEAFAEAVGTKGTVLVQQPPPEVNTRKKAVKVVDDLPDDAKGDAVVVWMGAIQKHDLREYASRVVDSGALWTVLPKGTKEFRAPVTEGDVKRTLLTLGWRETKVVTLSTDDYAVRFHRRR